MLAAIAAEPELAEHWIFKGGTCLRKCYYETYRFSEDLDFTVIDGGPEEPDELTTIFRRVSAWLQQESGIDLLVEDGAFVQRRNLRGNPTTQGRLAYRGPNPSRGTSPKLKLDVTSDEALVERPVPRSIVHSYGDSPLPTGAIRCYSLTELAAEKIRALAERCRPRDLYDVVHMHRHPDLLGLSPRVRTALAQKCAHAGIPVPDADAIRASQYAGEIEQEWENMLGHQLPRPLPPFAEFWNALDPIFAWLGGARPRPLQRAELGSNLDSHWSAPRAITSWRRGIPIETIRYAGANRLKVEIDYRAEQGRSGPRIVEPYSLRRTQDGNLILFVVNDHGQLRSYRVDRIAAVRPTAKPFTPRYAVEF